MNFGREDPAGFEALGALARKDDEIYALRDERDRAFMFADEMQKEAERLRALTDDAAVLLGLINEGRPIYAQGAVESERWMARYRETTGQ